MIKTFLVAGARPNFVKIAPILRAIKANNELFHPLVIHTGQHYDFNMSDSFFVDLKISRPDYFLEVGSGTHAEQTGKIMIEFEKVLIKEQPEIVIVVGDVNSTLASTVVASKMRYSPESHKFQVPFVSETRRPLIVHVEAGLRSFDRTMPEEINRIVTDSLSDILFTSEPDANDNLRKEGISQEKIHYVGNVMIDSLEMMKTEIEKCRIVDEIGLAAKDYGVITLHRPSNVDNIDNLKDITKKILEIAQKTCLVFPVHPRTKRKLEEGVLDRLLVDNENVKLLEPLPYKEFMKLMFNGKFVITDSGGLQEETTYLGIPCITLRSNTERPITITQGTNELVNVNSLEEKVDFILAGKWKNGSIPKYWDGNAAQRIVSILSKQIETM